MWGYESNKILKSKGDVFNEIIMYKNHLQKSKKENEDEEYINLDEIIEELILDIATNENAQQ